MGDVELGAVGVGRGNGDQVLPGEEHGLLHEDEDHLKNAGALVCRRMEGNHFLVYGKPRGRYFPMHCLMGPDWICSLCTVVLITVPSVFLVVAGMNALPMPIEIIGTVSFLVCITSYMVTAYSDPGIVKRQTRQQLEQSMADGGRIPKNGLLCDKCNVYRPQGARHCFDCDACILGYDHHCPWTGKCIGERNLKPFYIFLFSLLFHLVFVIFMFNLYIVHSKQKP